KVEAAGEGRLKVTGDLTIKDITRPVVLDVTLNKVGQHPMLKVPAIGFDATATIRRSDFGVGAYAPHVGDEVTLRITTEGSAPKAEYSRRFLPRAARRPAPAGRRFRWVGGGRARSQQRPAPFRCTPSPPPTPRPPPPR